MRNLAILLVFLTTGAIFAQCTLRPRTTYASYATTHVVQPTLYYQSGGYYYQYQGGHRGQLYSYHDGQYHHHEYKETVVLVPKAIQVEVQRDHYYSINSAASQDLLADAIVGRLLRMQQGEKIPSRVPPSGGTGPVGVKPKDTVLGDDRAGAYQEAATLKVVNDSCAKCHGVSSKYTKFVTADGQLTDLPAGKIWEAFGLVNSGEMPKGGKSLDDDSVKQFYAWAKSARKE